MFDRWNLSSILCGRILVTTWFAASASEREQALEPWLARWSLDDCLDDEPLARTVLVDIYPRCVSGWRDLSSVSHAEALDAVGREIASGHLLVVRIPEPKSGPASSQATSTLAQPEATVPAAIREVRYDEQFLLIDEETGEPLLDHPYALRTEDGRVFEGRSDANGLTQRIATDRAQMVSLLSHDEELDEPEEFDEQFVLIDPDTGAPLANHPYDLEADDGTVLSGCTDANGLTERIRTDGEQFVYLWVDEHDWAEGEEDAQGEDGETARA